jgi:hypothetical protein
MTQTNLEIAGSARFFSSLLDNDSKNRSSDFANHHPPTDAILKAEGIIGQIDLRWKNEGTKQGLGKGGG